jgi:hypothetical protein
VASELLGGVDVGAGVEEIADVGPTLATGASASKSADSDELAPDVSS